MTRSALRIALVISSSLVAACGGAPPASPPAETAVQPAEQPSREASPPAPTPPAATESTPAPSAAPPAPPPPKVRETPVPPARPAFTRTDLQAGTGRDAQKGKGLSVNYTGWLYDPGRPDLKGRMFDSSQGRGPFSFVLGSGQVIPGWDQGFDGMKVGGRRRLVIPPDLAYGPEGAGGGIIPPDATLIFEMELLDVEQ